MLSVFDLFKIGIGPSSSHTVGPMVAGKAFAGELAVLGLLPLVGRVTIDLFGSLALTGEGHGTTGAILGGLEGEEPASVDTAHLARRTAELKNNADLVLICAQAIPFVYERDMRLHKGMFLPRHSNAMKLTAHAGDGTELYTRTYYSIGGGFIRTDADFDREPETWPTPPAPLQNSQRAVCHLRKRRQDRGADRHGQRKFLAFGH